MRVLAGDIGGTKSHLGIFEPGIDRPLRSGKFRTAEHNGLLPLLREFLEGDRVEAGCLGVAGPVTGNRVRPPNLEWEEQDGDAIAAALALPRLDLVNDLAATAAGIPALTADEVLTLQEGDPDPEAPMAIIAAGTGLGMAIVVAGVTVPTEGGHADFAPRNGTESVLREWVAQGADRVEIEEIVSGPGLVNIRAFLNLVDYAHREDPAWIASNDPDAVDIFLGAYGSAARNLALTCLPRGGLYVGGGIAPRMKNRLRDGRFLTAFLEKGVSRPVLETIPVRVILNPGAALLGAARLAGQRFQ